PAEEVVQKLESLKQQKIEQIFQVVAFVKGEHCMREQLVAYFDQKLEQKPTNCCHYCGVNYDEIINKRSSEYKHKEPPYWEERLHSILP
ncbi:MAG TPA: RecQ family zinc-binding domain-containing protein, partial [Rummeliibacillus sp.]|nr:RecQ family zinc-binding domain-containing protein [Rummeliibacillus sp.]